MTIIYTSYANGGPCSVPVRSFPMLGLLLSGKPDTRTLAERFAFYRERNPAPLAYFFARRWHVGDTYSVPESIALAVLP